METRMLVVKVNGHRFAVPLEHVERVVRVVAITPSPGADPSLRGVINVGGEIVPVLDLRRCFGWPEGEIELSDRLVLVRVRGALAALLAEEVSGALLDAGPGWAGAAAPGGEGYRGFSAEDGEIVHLLDLERLLPAAADLPCEVTPAAQPVA